MLVLFIMSFQNVFNLFHFTNISRIFHKIVTKDNLSMMLFEYYFGDTLTVFQLSFRKKSSTQIFKNRIFYIARWKNSIERKRYVAYTFIFLEYINEISNKKTAFYQSYQLCFHLLN